MVDEPSTTAGTGSDGKPLTRRNRRAGTNPRNGGQQGDGTVHSRVGTLGAAFCAVALLAVSIAAHHRVASLQDQLQQLQTEHVGSRELLSTVQESVATLHTTGGNARSASDDSEAAVSASDVHEVRMWFGLADTFPKGWKQCDGMGANGLPDGSPDLRGRFIRAAGPDAAVNSQGGTDQQSVAVTLANMPVHTHSTDGWDYVLRVTGAGTVHSIDETAGGEPDLTATRKMDSVGGDEPLVFDNRPTFGTLLMLCRATRRSPETA